MTNSSKLVETLTRWLEIDSTTGREAAYLERLQLHLEQLGFECRRQPIEEGRWNLVAEASPNPSLLFSTHVDTVPPHLPVRVEDETIYGRGACDTKGGLLAMIEAARQLLESGLDDIGFLLVVGEEVDHLGAIEAQSLNLSPDRIILCEPTCNRVVSGQKGMLRVDIAAEGRAGHSAFPDSGVSAIHRLLDALDSIRDRDWPDDELLGETTLNVGTISGGVAANVFAPSAEAELLFRLVSPVDEVLESLRETVDASISIEPVASNDPVEFDPPDGVETCTVPFNTDATYLAEHGPIWLVGPGDIRVAHSDDEHIAYDDLERGIERYVSLARRSLDR
jgi:acetylornithine deacetylase